jgi:hypothetical protein
MSFSIEMVGILTDQLGRFVTLNRHQLVGHVANLDFWVAEVRHCLDVLDGYAARFERMKAAQEEYVSQHGTVEYDFFDPCCTQGRAAPPVRTPAAERKKARGSLCEATYRFLVRCFREGMLDEAALRRAAGTLGIGVETTDLRAPRGRGGSRK